MPWCSTGTDADVRDLPGIAVRWADCRFAFWNCLTLTEVGVGSDLLRQRLDEAAGIMRSKEHPGFLWVFDDLVRDDARAGLDAAAGQAGLEHAFPGTGMAGDFLPVPEPAHTRAGLRTGDDRRTPAGLRRHQRACLRVPSSRTAATAWPAPRCGATGCTPTWGCGTACR